VKVPDALRLAYGAALLARPQLLAGNSAGVGAARLRLVVRILGLRHLAQGALQALVPTRPVRLAGAAADAAHAATDAGYGALSGRWAPAAVDGTVAVVLGAANVALAWMPDTPAR
jgi:hypothetical protein